MRYESPETRYARAGDVHVAYQVFGEGERDIVIVPGWISHVEWIWELPTAARFLRRLASFSRVILFDKRGTGLSDRLPVRELPTLEERIDDMAAVLDAVGSERAVLFGFSDGGPMSILFAATYPARTEALILYGAYARRLAADDYPWGQSQEAHEQLVAALEQGWGGPLDVTERAPSTAGDDAFRHWWAQFLRLGASPSAARALVQMNAAIDVRSVLSTVTCPTLILHRRDDATIPVSSSRYMAERIAGARLVELAGADHFPFVGDIDSVLGEVEEFLTGFRGVTGADRVLATVLFTDIVGSTAKAVELGDDQWVDILEEHHRLVRRLLAVHRGREVDTAGDGFFATFDGPGRAVRCATAIGDAVSKLGIQIRAGIHTGECEVLGDGRVRGVAVHAGARVASLAGPGEVLVSSTVRDLVAGSGIEFRPRGRHTLKGLPGEWQLFAVVSV